MKSLNLLSAALRGRVAPESSGAVLVPRAGNPYAPVCVQRQRVGFAPLVECALGLLGAESGSGFALVGFHAALLPHAALCVGRAEPGPCRAAARVYVANLPCLTVRKRRAEVPLGLAHVR